MALLSVATPLAYADNFALEVGYHHIDYREELTLPAKSSEAGWMKLIGASAHQMMGKIHLTERASYATGSLKYDGADLFSGAPVTGEDTHSFISAEVTLGLQVTDAVRLYAGLLYRRWARPLSAYKETYNLYFAPVGLRWQSGESGGLNYGLDVSVRPLVKGSLLATMSDMGQGWDDKTLPVSSALGWRVEVPFILPLNGETGLVFSPFYQTLKLGKGDTVAITSGGQPVGNQGAYEPASTTVEYGARLSLAFAL